MKAMGAVASKAISSRGGVLVALRQQLHGVHHLDLGPLDRQHDLELREAGGAAAHNYIGLGLQDTVGLVASHCF